MSDAIDISRQCATSGGFRVRDPRAGDMLSGTLHSAYDRHGPLPDDVRHLLARLDRIDARPI